MLFTLYALTLLIYAVRHLMLTIDQVVDYTKTPVQDQLRESYCSQPFDKIIDCHGTPELYTACGSYLRPSPVAFTTVGIAHSSYTMFSVLYATSVMIKNMLLPSWLGGGTRAYNAVSSFVDLNALEKLKMEVEESDVKIVLDGGRAWRMQDALKVCPTE